MKKVLLLFLLVVCVVFGALVYFSPVKQVLQKHLPSITPEITYPPYKKPEQYFGATVDMSQLLPESKHYVVNNKGEDIIVMAHNLGLNTLRITNIASISDKKITPPYSHKQWQEVLTKMEHYGLSADILVESNAADSQYFDNELSDYYLNYVKQYVIDSQICTFKNVFAVDIRNEPLLDTNNLSYLKKASDLVHSSCPNMVVTIGSWRTDSGQKDKDGQEIYNWHDPKGAALLKDTVDIYAIHLYGFDKDKDGVYPDPNTVFTSYLHEIQKYTGGKPILIEEFGAGNGSGVTDQHTTGSQDLQTQTYRTVLTQVKSQKDKNLMGAIAYLFLTRNGQTDGWAIAENNGNVLLPAAYTFQEVNH